MDDLNKILDDTHSSFTEIAAPIKETLVDSLNGFLAHLPYLVAGIFILILTWLLSYVLKNMLNRAFRFSDLRLSLKVLLQRFIMIGFWIIGFLISAMIIIPDLTPSKALGGLGILSIAIGFAFRDIFENFFAGILLLWRFPFENGDYIECQDIAGEVEDVTIRNTEIRIPSGELIVVPNSFLFKNPVTIMTNRPSRRISIIAGVAYGEDVEQAVGVISKAVTDCETVDKKHQVQVFPQGFGSSSIDIEVAWWTAPKPIDERKSRGEVVTAVKRALDNAGIEIPFPYRTLTFKEPLSMKRLEKDTDNED